MNTMNFTIAGQSYESIPVWLIILIVVGGIAWLWSIVRVATKRTKDPYDRIVWLLIILALNIVGTILYVLFGMESTADNPVDHRPITTEEELKRRANEGTLR